MDFENAASLLWAQQLKREHRFLLQRIESLESKGVLEGNLSNETNEQRLVALEQALLTSDAQQKQDQDRFLAQLNNVHHQQQNFIRAFEQNCKDAVAAGIQESGLPKLVSEISQKLSWLDTEVGDDALTLTTTVSQLSYVTDALNNSMKRTSSVDDALTSLKTQLSSMSTVQRALQAKCDQSIQNWDELAQRVERMEQKLGGLESSITNLRQRQLHIDTANELVNEAGAKQDLSCVARNSFGADSRVSAIATTTEVPSTNGRSDELSDGHAASCSTSQESKRHLDDEQDSRTFAAAAMTPVDKTTRVVAAAGPSLPGQEQHQLDMLNDTGITHQRFEATKDKSPSGSLPRPLLVSNNFFLPVILPGLQTRSRTRAAISTSSGVEQSDLILADGTLQAWETTTLRVESALSERVGQNTTSAKSGLKIPHGDSQRVESAEFTVVSPNFAPDTDSESRDTRNALETRVESSATRRKRKRTVD